MSYRAPQLNQYEFPLDPKQLQVAIKKASDFNDDVRDVRDLMSYLERMLSCIPKLSRHKLRRTSHISSANWDIVPLDDKDESATELANQAEVRLRTIIKQYTRKYTEGELFGLSLQRLVWDETKAGRVPRIEYSYKPYEMERNFNYPQNMAILAGVENGKFRREKIPEELKQNYLVQVADYPEPGGILRTVIYPAFMINLSQQEWSQYIQFLKGIIQAKVKLGASPEDKAAAMEAVKDAVKNKASVTSELVEFTWERMNNENAGNAFDTFLQSCYELLEIAITNTSMMATDKDRNALTVLERGEEDLAREMRFDYEILINEQLLRHDYYMNVDKSKYGIELPYEFKMTQKLKQDKVANANIILQAIGLGLPFTIKTWNEKTGIPLAGEPDSIITTQFTNDLTKALDNEN